MKVTALILSTAGIALLLGAASASAGITYTTATIGSRTADSAELATTVVRTDSLSSRMVSPISTVAFALLQAGGNSDYSDGHDGNHDHDGDKDGDHDGSHGRGRDHDKDHDHAPAPAPEPLTALLFGAAMLICGGILRRQYRRNQN
jgi:hypothetical protein